MVRREFNRYRRPVPRHGQFDGERTFEPLRSGGLRMEFDGSLHLLLPNALILTVSALLSFGALTHLLHLHSCVHAGSCSSYSV